MAQIGRVIARELGLDEDLTEALCLGHDIGHPPFGHAGETALEEAMVQAGGYDHNAQGLRTLARLESPYCDHDGLNLTWETLEGLAKHNGPVAAPNWALAEIDAAFPLELDSWPSLEAQVAALADDIAYDNHDIDDGLRAGFLELDDLLTLDLLADQWRAVERRFPHAPHERKLRELVRTQIGLMVNDLLTETRSRLVGASSVDEVRDAGKPLAAFSAGMAEQERRLKKFMYDRLYYHPEQLATAERARCDLSALCGLQPGSLDHARRLAGQASAGRPQRSRHIADFIAGMTDRFAIEQVRRIYGRAPEGLSNVDALRIVLVGRPVSAAR